ALQRPQIFEHPRIQRRSGIQAHQLEAHHAEVRVREGPVPQTAGSQRAAVAHSVREYPPGKRQLIAVLPRDLDHLTIVMVLRSESEQRHARRYHTARAHMTKSLTDAVRSVDVVRWGSPERVEDHVA